MTSDKSEGIFYSEAWYVHPYTFVYSETTVCFSPSFEGSDAKWHILSMPGNEKASLLQSEGFGVQRRYALGLTLVLCYLNEGIKNHHLPKEFLTYFLLFHILPFFCVRCSSAPGLAPIPHCWSEGEEAVSFVPLRSPEIAVSLVGHNVVGV